ncbi:MAG: hypothetical protein AB1578_20880 [Thermodesulfobacteriota bacterium]
MPRNRRRDQLLRLFNELGPIARTFGVRLSFAQDGRAVVDLPYVPVLEKGAAP